MSFEDDHDAIFLFVSTHCATDASPALRELLAPRAKVENVPVNVINVDKQPSSRRRVKLVPWVFVTVNGAFTHTHEWPVLHYSRVTQKWFRHVV